MLLQQKIIGKYEVLEILGKGTFGTTYRVRLGKEEFAIKMIPKNQLTRAAYDSIQFNKVQELNHRNIVTTLQTFQDSRHFYIKMELLLGGTLRSLIKSRGQTGFTEHQVAVTASTLLNAIMYIHRHNIIHRDIKPQNIMLAERQNLYSLKLGDFGLSTYLFNHRQLNKYKGTPYYMAPEVVLGIPYDKSIDIWSIGVVLFRLFTKGRYLFKVNQHCQLEKAMQFFQYQYQTDISQNANHLLSCLLKKQARERYVPFQILLHPFLTEQLEGRVSLNYNQSMAGFQDQQTFTKVLKAIYFIKFAQDSFKHDTVEQELVNGRSLGTSKSSFRIRKNMQQMADIKLRNQLASSLDRCKITFSNDCPSRLAAQRIITQFCMTSNRPLQRVSKVRFSVQAPNSMVVNEDKSTPGCTEAQNSSSHVNASFKIRKKSRNKSRNPKARKDRLPPRMPTQQN